MRVAAALLFVLALFVWQHLPHLPAWLPIAYAAMSTLTLLLYAIDKFAAVRGERRLPELHLHLFALLGGWPGALIAQQLFRHKRRKGSFMIRFWVVTALNLAVLGWWLLWHHA